MLLTGDFGAEEVLESAGVIEVKMAHDDGFDVFDIVACGFDCVGELHLLGVDCAWEEIGVWRTPFLFSFCQFTVPWRSLTSGRKTYDLDVLGAAGLE